MRFPYTPGTTQITAPPATVVDLPGGTLNHHRTKNIIANAGGTKQRDELGNDLVPDYMTSVQEIGFYGWPYSYYGPNVDERVKPPRRDLVATAIKPDYALGPHTASLGLAYAGMPGVSPTR